MNCMKNFFAKNLFTGDCMECGAGSWKYSGLFSEVGSSFVDVERNVNIEHYPWAYYTNYGLIGSRIAGLKPLIFFMRSAEIKSIISIDEALQILREKREEEPKYFVEKLFVGDYMECGAGSLKHEGLYYQIGDYFYDIERKHFVEQDPYAYFRNYGSIGSRVTGIKQFIDFILPEQLKEIMTEEEALAIFKQKDNRNKRLVKRY